MRLLQLKRLAWRLLARVRARVLLGHHARLVAVTPRIFRRAARLPDASRGSRRVEIGCGFSPRPGYLHVERTALHGGIDLIAHAADLPIPDDWADEILSVHVIEHLRPPTIGPTLDHWYGRLRPGGTLVLHTPNGEALGRVLADPSVLPERLWAAQSAVFGYGLPPWDATSPDALSGVVEHTVLFTEGLLRAMLETAGFEQITNVSGSDVTCHHTRDWNGWVDGLCLEITARRPSTA